MKKIQNSVFDYQRRLFASIERSGLHPPFYFDHLNRETEKKRKEETQQRRGPEIKDIRRRVLGVSQSRLAKMLRVTQQTVSEWETHNKGLDELTGPKRKRLERLMGAA